MNTQSAIMVCGEALIDLAPTGPATEYGLVSAVGGAPFNVALALGRLSVPVQFLGRLSTDPNGDRFVRALGDAGVDLSLTQRGDEPSALAYVFRPQPGEADVRYTFYLDGTTENAIGPDLFPTTPPADVAAFQMGCLSAVRPETGPLILDFAKKIRKTALVSYDPNIRPLFFRDRDATRALVEERVAVSDIVKLSDADMGWLYPGASELEVATRMRELGATLVAVTRGPDGAMVYGPGFETLAAGFPAKVVDTIGAGDCFMASFLWRLRESGLLSRNALEAITPEQAQEAARMANKAASIVVGRHGADAPTLDDLNNA